MANDYRGLLSGSNWGGIETYGAATIVTYSFASTAPAYVATIDDPNLTPAALASYQGFSTAEQAMARTALAEWADASGLTFIEVAPGQGDINFGKLDFSGTGYDGAGGIGYHPFGDWQFASYPYFTSDLDSSGDIFMNSDVPIAYGTLLHEIGHAIGLKHPTEQWTDYAASPPVTHDVWSADDPALTIMSQLSGGTGHLTSIDIDAVRYIYGTHDLRYTWDAGTQTLRQVGDATDQALRGSSVLDILYGRAGDDKLFGLNGADKLYGEDGDDLLDGGPGADQMRGDAGDDRYFVDNARDRVTEAVDEGHDSVVATASWTMAANVEQLQFWGDARLTGRGNALGNAMFANGAGNTLRGLEGDDYLVGGDGKDTLDGGDGGDVIYGGASADLITGGIGADQLHGDGGADRFIYTDVAESAGNARDMIIDFSHGEHDRIDLRKIDADPNLAGDQAFAFIGTAAFTGAGHEVRYVSGLGATVQVDVDGDKLVDMAFSVQGATTLVAGDFLL